MVVLAGISSLPLAVVPFASSIVLVSGAPTSRPASSSAIVFGHLICAASGLVFSALDFDKTTGISAAVAMSVVLMLLFDVFHPPAGVTPLIVYGSAAHWDFLFIPVLIGAISVAVLARTTERLHQIFQEPTSPENQGVHR